MRVVLSGMRDSWTRDFLDISLGNLCLGLPIRSAVTKGAAEKDTERNPPSAPPLPSGGEWLVSGWYPREVRFKF